jgi:hypothetical protein
MIFGKYVIRLFKDIRHFRWYVLTLLVWTHSVPLLWFLPLVCVNKQFVVYSHPCNEGIQDEATMACFEVRSSHMYGQTEENREKVCGFTLYPG